jgi:hypothetical protein
MSSKPQNTTLFYRILSAIINVTTDRLAEPIVLLIADMTDDRIAPALIKAKHDLGVEATELITAYMAWSFLKKQETTGNWMIDGALMKHAKTYWAVMQYALHDLEEKAEEEESQQPAA